MFWALFILLLSLSDALSPHKLRLIPKSVKLWAGKGFGKVADDGPSLTGFLEGLSPSLRPGDSKKLGGKYGNLVASKLEVFSTLKKKGMPIARDVYCRLSNDDTFWFIGKVIHDTSVISDTSDALSVLEPLLKEYGRTLRPKELAGPKAALQGAELQIWTAPPCSEMDTVQHKNTLERVVVDVERIEVLNSETPKEAVGWEPEIYSGGEDGFRVHRHDDGSPKRPPIEVQVKSKEEMGM